MAKESKEKSPGRSDEILKILLNVRVSVAKSAKLASFAQSLEMPGFVLDSSVESGLAHFSCPINLCIFPNKKAVTHISCGRPFC
ncbi:MAG: hypothetical protein ACKVU2_00770 [Saprospiraceae bacterium]